MIMKHKYYVFIYPINEYPVPQNENPVPQNENPVRQNDGCIRVVEKIMPLKRWAREHNRKLYIQKVY